MAININQRFNELMAQLEANVENKKDLEYIKNQFSTLFLDFLYEIEGITDESEKKLAILEEKQKQLEEKSERVEQMVHKMEKDIYLNDNYDFEVVCPYCNCEFETEFDDLKKEIPCPECGNIIELDWNEDEEECEGNCSCCHGSCGEETQEEVDSIDEGLEQEKKEEDEDM